MVIGYVENPANPRAMVMVIVQNLMKMTTYAYVLDNQHSLFKQAIL
jgi:hypothetical protein